MHIVCLAWGSLLWKPGSLSLRGPWQPGGPLLPIEFSRVGDSHELATVLCPGVAPTRVWWAPLGDISLDTAAESLRVREGIPAERRDAVGRLRLDDDQLARDSHPEAIRHWARDQPDVQAVVWTALPPRFDGEEGRVPTADEAVRYLGLLTGEAREHAERYVRRVPPEFDTPNRRAIEAALGWRFDKDA